MILQDGQSRMMRRVRGVVAVVGAIGAITFGGCSSGKSESVGGTPVSAAPVGFTAGTELTDRAEQLKAQGDRDAAIREFIAAIQENPTLTRAHLGLADIYREAGDYAVAERGYRRAAEIEPQNFDAQYYHGLMLHVVDRVAESIAAYLRALSIRPDDFQTTVNLATAYYQLSENRQALPFAEKAVKLNPKDGPARYTLGAVYAELGRHSEAVIELQQATESMELSPPLLLALGKSLGRLERWDEMRNALEQSTKMAPDKEGFERLGFAQFKLREFAASAASFQRSLAIDPNYFPALNGLGVGELNTWITSDRNDEQARGRGLNALRRSLAINRNQPRIEELLARYGK